MATTNISKNELERSLPRTKRTSRIIRVMFSRWVVVLGAVLILVFLILAVFSPLLAPYDPNDQNLRNTLQPPSSEHLLGTDALGRDTLSRLIHGAWISLVVGVIAVSISGVIGMALGLIAGYAGPLISNIIMRIIDALMAIPPLVLMLAIAVVLGGGLLNTAIAISVGLVPTYCRLMYGQVLTIKENDYVTAANVIGASDMRIILNYLLPNTLPPLLVLFTLNIGSAILLEASLSFLGIGIPPPTATWGSMVSEGYRYLLKSPLLSFVPGVSIMLTVLAFNLVGDGLRDALDPRLRGTI